MKVWTVTNEHGNGDKCCYNNYKDALYCFEVETSEDEDIKDLDWYSMFRKLNSDGTMISKEKEMREDEQDLKLGEWVLQLEEWTEKEYNELPEFDGF